MALLYLLSYIRKGARQTIGLIQVPEVVLRQFVKERPPPRVVDGRCDPLIAGLRRCASRLALEMKKARILSESGPLRTELGGRAPTRFPLPDAFGPRSDQAA